MSRVAMVGTPNLGAPLAYYLWQGSDPVRADFASGGLISTYRGTSVNLYWTYFGALPNPIEGQPAGLLQENFFRLYQTFVPSIQFLLPTGLVLVDDDTLRSLQCPAAGGMLWQNWWLKDLNADASLTRFGTGGVELALLGSNLVDTVGQIDVDWEDGDCDQALPILYPDGQPSEFHHVPGDGTVPLISLRGPFPAGTPEALAETDVKHAKLVGHFSSCLAEFVVDGASDEDPCPLNEASLFNSSEATANESGADHALRINVRGRGAAVPDRSRRSRRRHQPYDR